MPGFSRMYISVLPLSKSMQYDTNLYMLNQAAQNYLKDGLFTDDEEQRINEFVSVMGISLNNLPATSLMLLT